MGTKQTSEQKDAGNEEKREGDSIAGYGCDEDFVYLDLGALNEAFGGATIEVLDVAAFKGVFLRLNACMRKEG